MELKNLAIALLALYILYSLLIKEKYAFDETGLQFPVDAGYIDIYHKNQGGNIQIDKVEFSKNISSENQGDINIKGNTATIKGFTSKVPKSILGYGVNYDENKKVAFYRPMNYINTTNIQVELTPGKELSLKNMTTTNLGASFPLESNPKGKGMKVGFKDGEVFHTGRFVFTF
uniref:Uncharacterized protein n=1 Tax=viral metagenome TaxID=1070528 RepID=A0A6C0DK99_9ZZZZ